MCILYEGKARVGKHISLPSACCLYHLRAVSEGVRTIVLIANKATGMKIARLSTVHITILYVLSLQLVLTGFENTPIAAVQSINKTLSQDSADSQTEQKPHAQKS